MSTPRTMTGFWWRTRRNFGDELGPFLLERLSGIELVHAAPADAELVSVGSVLDLLPPDWEGTVVGSGKLHEHFQPSLDHARVLALRGHLSALGVPGDYALGDPGLLVDELVPQPPEPPHRLGLIAHWSDVNGVLAARFAHLEPLVIDVADDPITVIQQIASCERLVTSSLHGVVVADAYGIPRRAERFPYIDKPYEGGDFKFHDYASAINTPFEFGVMQRPHRADVERRQAELHDVFKELQT